MIFWVVILPLIGFLIAGLLGRSLPPRLSELVTTVLMIVSAVLSWILFVQIGFNGLEPYTYAIAPWIHSGSFDVSWSLRVDTLTVVMLVVVNSVSALVHLYSIGYMSHDPHRPRFFAYLSLFTFAMLMLVTSDNLLQMFFGWEGVGLASYLLIGFWFKKPSANAAAMKAFIVNRVGDFGYILGIFLIFILFESAQFDVIFNAVETQEAATFKLLGFELHALTLICFLLFMGAMGKSAQFLLHTWLPDAMEGPTPVSALIHAATMVTAGVFLVARMSPLYEFAPDALAFVTFIGATTAFFAATIGLVQNDIKRVIAYSTCSQLGYMFVALGLGAYSVAVFHLFTHAFFKALLFLGAGSVIHAVSNEQDMRKMGGLAKHIPFTYAMMLIGTVALTGLGIPGTYIGTAGFFSKDAIVEAAYAGQNIFSNYAFVMVVIAAFFTSFYSWRLIFLTFHGRARAKSEVMSHVHESPLIMTLPLIVLAVGAIGAGFMFKAEFAYAEGVMAFFKEALFIAPENTILKDLHEVPFWVKASPFIMMVLGFILSFLFYILKPALPHSLATQHDALYKFLLNKWYFDELYDALFVKPSLWLGRFLWQKGDKRTIDGLGPDGISARTLNITRIVSKVQTGYLYHYAFIMLIGLAGLLSWVIISGSTF